MECFKQVANQGHWGSYLGAMETVPPPPPPSSKPPFLLNPPPETPFAPPITFPPPLAPLVDVRTALCSDYWQSSTLRH